MMRVETLDERDAALLAARDRARPTDGPQVGEFVVFADGTVRRISYVAPADWLPDPGRGVGAQTSDVEAGHYYLGDGYCSYSGGLYPFVRADVLDLVEGETRSGACWFFHHDAHRAHNGIDVEIPWRVWTCSVEAPR